MATNSSRTWMKVKRSGWFKRRAKNNYLKMMNELSVSASITRGESDLIRNQESIIETSNSRENDELLPVGSVPTTINSEEEVINNYDNENDDRDEILRRVKQNALKEFDAFGAKLAKYHWLMKTARFKR